MSRIRGAVIGIGGIGKEHARMQLASGRIDLVALCDANPAARGIAEKEFLGVGFYCDIAQMLAQATPDLVSIATPHVLHAPQAISCLAAGAMVVVEKPMATTFEDAQAMIKASRTYGRPLTVYHNRRLDPWQLAAKAAVDDGLLGTLFEINIGIGGANRDTTWRADKIASGGVLFDWGAHLVDYALILASSEVVAVSGWLYRRAGSLPTSNEDHGSISIRFASGARANITVSNLVYDGLNRYHLLGEKASLSDTRHWSDDGKLRLRLAALQRGPGRQRDRLPPGEQGQLVQPHRGPPAGRLAAPGPARERGCQHQHPLHRRALACCRRHPAAIGLSHGSGPVAAVLDRP